MAKLVYAPGLGPGPFGGGGSSPLARTLRGFTTVESSLLEFELMALERPLVEPPVGEAPADLQIVDEVVGSGAEAVAGKSVSVHYVGVAWSTGEEFDASWNRGDAFSFTLGAGQVIGGWDQGVQGMNVGGRRRLTIPPHLGYGAQGAGGVIKPNESLIFIVDLLEVN